MGGFREFLTKSNALALAIGVIIGAALGAVVNSLVNDIIMPPIGCLLGGVDFANIKIVLGTDQARPATEVAIGWGLFINSLIVFVIVMLVVVPDQQDVRQGAATRRPDGRGDAPDRDPRRAAQAQRLRRPATARSIDGPAGDGGPRDSGGSGSPAPRPGRGPSSRRAPSSRLVRTSSMAATGNPAWLDAPMPADGRDQRRRGRLGEPDEVRPEHAGPSPRRRSADAIGDAPAPGELASRRRRGPHPTASTAGEERRVADPRCRTTPEPAAGRGGRDASAEVVEGGARSTAASARCGRSARRSRAAVSAGQTYCAGWASGDLGGDVPRARAASSIGSRMTLVSNDAGAVGSAPAGSSAVATQPAAR